MAWTVRKPLAGRLAPGTLISRIAWAMLLATPWFLLPAFGRDRPAQTAPQDEIALTFSASDQAEIKRAVVAILPASWVITKTKLGSTPPDWYSDDPRGGFQVECTDGQETCRVWFLPLDWIGIRQVPNKATRTCYWEGVLGGSKYKTVTHCNNDKLQDAMHQLFKHGMSTPSLINSGYSRAADIFAHRMDTADAVSRRLIKEHCTTPREFEEEAAHSLVVLGVPAKTVFLRAAREVEGSEKDAFTGVLGLMGGDEAIGVLCEILADPKVDDYSKKYTAMALEEHADKRIGPALYKAMKEMHPTGEAFDRVVKDLGSRRHEAAVPDLLRLLRDPEKKACWPAVSYALATLRCKEAIPDLRKIVEQNPYKKDESPTEDSYTMALLRLESDWGKAGEERRYMIWLPAEAIVGQPIKAVVYEENVAAGHIRFSSMDVTEDDFMVNGKSLIEPGADGLQVFGGSIISWQAPPGYVSRRDLDLSEHIAKPGRYKIRFGLGDVHSNEAVIVLRPAPP